MPQYHNVDITTLQLHGTCILRPRSCTVPVNFFTTQEIDGEGKVAVFSANGGSNSYRGFGTYLPALFMGRFVIFAGVMVHFCEFCLDTGAEGTGGTCPQDFPINKAVTFLFLASAPF